MFRRRKFRKLSRERKNFISSSKKNVRHALSLFSELRGYCCCKKTTTSSSFTNLRFETSSISKLFRFLLSQMKTYDSALLEFFFFIEDTLSSSAFHLLDYTSLENVNSNYQNLCAKYRKC